jgi:hypothetical protein
MSKPALTPKPELNPARNSATHVQYARFASVKYQLKLEKVGLKSSGGALRPRLAEEFGLGPRAKHDDFIAYVQAKMEELLEAKRKEAENEQ